MGIPESSSWCRYSPKALLNSRPAVYIISISSNKAGMHRTIQLVEV